MSLMACLLNAGISRRVLGHMTWPTWLFFTGGTGTRVQGLEVKTSNAATY